MLTFEKFMSLHDKRADIVKVSPRTVHIFPIHQVIESTLLIVHRLPQPSPRHMRPHHTGPGRESRQSDEKEIETCVHIEQVTQQARILLQETSTKESRDRSVAKHIPDEVREIDLYLFIGYVLGFRGSLPGL